MPSGLALQHWPDTREETYERMKSTLAHLVPDVEIRYKADLAWEINHLKAERGAVILGHNYMEPALYHSVPDYRGDSLELSRIAADTDRDPIVFCGVRFMAETAKLLNPGRTVLIPSARAGCSLAESVNAADVRRLKARYPGVPVVSYVNTYAEVKAESDVCCTSGNAARIVEALDADTVIFLPDEYLAKNVARETGKRIVVAGRDGGGEDAVVEPGEVSARARRAAGIVGWEGRCEVHEKFTVDDILAVRAQVPGVLVLAHPECSPEVVEASDFSGSTSAMVRFVADRPARSYLLLTECSMGDNIAAENPDKEMVRLCSVRCPHMNEITLEDTLASLREMRYVVDVPPEIAAPARRALQRMLELSAGSRVP